MAKCELFPLGVFLLLVGLTSVIKPEWDAKIEKWRRTNMSNMRPEDVELSGGWYDFTRGVGLILTFFGGVVTLGCLV